MSDRGDSFTWDAYGASAFARMREGEGVIAETGGVYRDGDRFKAFVSCAPGTKTRFASRAVFGRGEASFPLAAPSELECGNAVPIADAFRVTGRERMIVCLVWQPEGAIDRELLARTPPDLVHNARCTPLESAP